MKTLASALLAGILVLGAAGAWAQDSDKDTKTKVKDTAKTTGKTVTHGATAVGKGASKIFHDMAKGVHKTIAHNTDDPHKKNLHLQKAHAHHAHAAVKGKQADKELNKAKANADQVGK
jgi:hypothetical protein